MICNADGCQPLCAIHPAYTRFDAVEVADGQNLLAILEAGDRFQRLVKTVEGHGQGGETAILRSCVPSMSGTPKNACPIFSSHSGKASLCMGFPEVIALRINVCWAYAEDAMARIPMREARPDLRAPHVR